MHVQHQPRRPLDCRARSHALGGRNGSQGRRTGKAGSERDDVGPDRAASQKATPRELASGVKPERSRNVFRPMPLLFEFTEAEFRSSAARYSWPATRNHPTAVHRLTGPYTARIILRTHHVGATLKSPRISLPRAGGTFSFACSMGYLRIGSQPCPVA